MQFLHRLGISFQFVDPSKTDAPSSIEFEFWGGGSFGLGGAGRETQFL